MIADLMNVGVLVVAGIAVLGSWVAFFALMRRDDA